MKLCRFGPTNAERPACLDRDGILRDLSDVVDDISPAVLGDEAIERLRRVDHGRLPPVPEGARLGPCVAGIGKFICVGLNYSDHAAETGVAVPAEPVLFMKATSAVTGPNDPILIPPGATQCDWEVELGVVIGRTARGVAIEQALDHVAGYALVNDVSERAFQLQGTGQWVKGKSADSFGPLGPWLVTRDEIPDPQALGLWLRVNGVERQRSSTRNMVHGVASLVAYVSRFMTLHPGDILSTGTPAGVALGLSPPPYLVAGDIVELGIEGLGEQRQIVRHAAEVPLRSDPAYVRRTGGGA